VVGIGTVLTDDPQLTVRHPGLPPKEPLRVVVDSRLRMPADARVLSAGDPARVVVACVAPAPSDRAAALRDRGVRVLELPNDGGHVDLRALLDALIASTEAAGIWTIESGIFPENTASLALHRAAGFRVVGVRQRIGCHLGRPGHPGGWWRDTVLIERRSASAG